MFTEKVSWDEIKIKPGTLGYTESSKMYYVFKSDGSHKYETSLYKPDYDQEETDTKDFYDNYKTYIDTRMPEITTTSLPNFCQTYFCGSGDTSAYAASALGAGEGIFFSLGALDESKTKTIQFNDDFYVVDGYFCGKSAPFGASVDVEILDYNDNVVACFAKKIPIFNSIFHFENTNRAFISKYYKIRITVYNTECGLFNEHDTACAFKVFGCLKIYRKNIYYQ